jgi:hypothetical protein
MNDLVYLPSPKDDGFVELARVGSGRIFKKQILPPVGGEFTHPSDKTRKVKVTQALVDSLQRNFADSICDIVQVPVCDDKNRHTEDPLRNMGEVIDIQQTDKGTFAVIDARKHADELGKTLIGASAMMHLNYEDTKTGEKKGPTLLHVAVTNRPYITQLEGYQEIIAASADNTGEEPVVMMSAATLEDDEITTAEEHEMTPEEMIAALKATGYSVLTADELAALQVPAAAPTAVPVELSNVLNLSAAEGSDITLDDIAAGVVELANNLSAAQSRLDSITEERDALTLSNAETAIDALVAEGRILPHQRDDMLALSVTDHDMFERILPKDAIVELSERGVTTHDPKDTGNSAPVVESYAERANQLQAPRVRNKTR